MWRGCRAAGGELHKEAAGKAGGLSCLPVAGEQDTGASGPQPRPGHRAAEKAWLDHAGHPETHFLNSEC